MNLSIDGQTAMAQRIHQWVHKFTKGKWVVTGGGGYAIVDVVPRAWTQLIAEVCGHGLSTDTELSGDLRNDDASVITQMTTGTSQQGDSGRRRGQRLLLVTTLNASLLEQLAMLLLSHALAPLLDD